MAMQLGRNLGKCFTTASRSPAAFVGVSIARTGVSGTAMALQPARHFSSWRNVGKYLTARHFSEMGGTATVPQLARRHFCSTAVPKKGRLGRIVDFMEEVARAHLIALAGGVCGCGIACVEMYGIRIG